MKYESNILERLIKTYGVVGNPKYVSEIIKQFIIQGKECYPNLFTYQSDWLAHIDEFGLANDYVVTYTGHRFYAPNTKESPVKRAILKGQTLVNMLKFKETFTALYNIGSYVYSDNKITIVGNGVGDGFAKSDITVNLESNKTYTFKGNCDKGFNVDNGFIYLLLNNSSSKVTRINTGNTTFQVSESGVYYVRLDIRDSSQTYIFSDLMILEGDYTNQDIPYFKGMKSVKMPVLSTIGKNLNNSDIEIGSILDSTGLPTSSVDVKRTKDFIKIKPNTSLVFSSDDAITRIFYYDINMNFIKWEYSNTSSIKITTPINCYYVKVRFASTNSTYLQIEQNTQSTEYEPYKSNILTVNEDVTLRSVKDVRDELDCLTGDVTERVGEVVLDGSENWIVNGYTNNQSDVLSYFSFKLSSLNCILNQRGDGLSSELNNIDCASSPNSEGWQIYNGQMRVNVLKSKLSEDSVNGFKQWLSQNPITVQYKLETPVIKTVDLSIVDQDNQSINKLSTFEGGTHFDTSSQTGSLLPTLGVDVVVDLEETLMMCSTEGNTM